MKVRRTLSGILFGAGCAFTFIGLLALLLPCVDNPQLSLVLASFDLPSEHPVVSLMNQGMSYALHNGWQVLFVGLAMLAVGLILLLIFTREPKRSKPRETFGNSVLAYVPEWETPQPSGFETNPFATAALWEHQFAPAKKQEPENESSFTVFGGPMLEPNRIDDEPAPVFTSEVYARPAAAHDPQPVEKPHEEVSAPAKPVPLHEPVIPAPAVPVKPDPVYTPNEEPNEPTMLSSRIRSTVGRRRDWE